MFVIKIDETGTVKALYNEGLTPLISEAMGTNPSIKRWSNIEYSNEAGAWQVTINKVVVHEESTRQACVDWEHAEYELRT